MCGIVGYSGNSDAIGPIIEGLSRLEYRGYDSAGISIQVNHELKVFKKEGKLKNLEKLLVEKNAPQSSLGIGHTRWATHGKVNDTNSHPHGNEYFSIVHNGIIENASRLKEELSSQGYHFQSETDSEVFLVKLTDVYQKLKDIQSAILETFKAMEGNSAFVIISKDSHQIFCIKKSAPLVCGINEASNEVYLSSDPYALVGFSSKLYFPENNVLCVGDNTNHSAPLSFYDLEGKPSKDYKIQKKELNLDVVSKGRFEHFMLKEIFEQPELVKKLCIAYEELENKEILNNIATVDQPRFIHIIACGTALHAGLVIKNFLEKKNQIRVQTDFASEFRYKSPLMETSDIGLFISQSGETADTLACQELCKEQGLKTYAIVNVEGSTLYRNCDENLLTYAGTEIGVASTKAFTQMVLVGYILSHRLLNKADGLEEELNKLSLAISKVLDQEEEIRKIAIEIYNYKGFIFTGRGEQYPVALEGALKLKEIAYVHAEGYAAGELKHGPIALFDENLVNIAIITDELFEKTFSNMQEVKSRRGVMVVLGEGNQKEVKESSDYYLDIDYCGLTDLKPVVSNIVLQLLSYHIAKFKGTDIDMPRNLAKSVTVE